MKYIIICQTAFLGISMVEALSVIKKFSRKREILTRVWRSKSFVQLYSPPKFDKTKHSVKEYFSSRRMKSLQLLNNLVFNWRLLA